MASWFRGTREGKDAPGIWDSRHDGKGVLTYTVKRQKIRSEILDPDKL